MKVNSKIILFIIPLVFHYPLSFASEYASKKAIVDKHLKKNISFEKKVKVLAAFQSWADKELVSNADKFSDDELTEVMQFSTLLKAAALKKLSPKTCSNAVDNVIEADMTPLSEDLSAAGLKTIEWLKQVCPKPAKQKGKEKK